MDRGAYVSLSGTEPNEPALSDAAIPEIRQKAIQPRDLWAAVDALTNPRRQKLRRDDGAVEWFILPSLWDQLIEAMEKNTGDQGNGKMRSRPPMNMAAMSLLLRIAGMVRDERHQRLREAKASADGARVRTLKGRPPLNTPGELRQVISDVIRSGDQPIRDTEWTIFEWWEDQIRAWSSQIRTTIGVGDTWRLYGAACRTCRAMTVPAFEDGKENGRQPALVVYTANGIVTGVICDMCGSSLADIHLRDLWDQARQAKEMTA